MFQPKPGFHPREAWFRSPTWDDEARNDFETHLARARRDLRVQYKRVKALALLRSGRPAWETVGYEFLRQISRDPDAHNFERVLAHSELGSYDQEHGRLVEAERSLRLALAAMRPNASGGDGLETVRLAEVLLDQGGDDRLAEARRLLEEHAEHPSIFVKGRFRLCVTATRVALASKHFDDAASWAAAALRLAEATHSGLAHHPGLGLVQLDGKQRKWLSAVAAGAETRDIHRR